MVNGPRFCRGHEREAKTTGMDHLLQFVTFLEETPVSVHESKTQTASLKPTIHRCTEQSDGVAQLTGPLSPRFCVQLVQTLHDVPITNFTITKVTLQTGAPEGQRDR